MKLLELHIRNIASIEKADIDFRKQDGLIDPDTHQPAQTFLIYGDTGTGKSVLLDCIAMALFKTTPRIENVEDKRKNSFTSHDGDTINIFSIEQYTRLGITEKDECYSEVVFEGNDNRVSHAKLELGYSKKRNGQLSHKLDWTFKHGDGEWVKVDKNGELIEAVVGVDFKKFNRMSMLAQGQFASFLCGSRDERSDILEKLTNTEIFSRYGEAIKRLSTRYKTDTNNAKTVLDTERQHLPKQEELDALEKQKNESCARCNELSKAIEKNDHTLGLLDKIAEAQKEYNEANTKLNEYREKKKEEKYCSSKTLYIRWDQTEQERQALNNLNKSKNDLLLLEKEEEALCKRYHQLSSGLSCAEKKLNEQDEALRIKYEWLQSQHDRKELYSQSEAIYYELDGYQKLQQEIEEKKQKKNEADQQVQELQVKLKSKESNYELSKKAVQDKQQEIDQLVNEQKIIDLSHINERKRDITILSNAYTKLLEDYTRHVDEKKKRDDLSSELDNIKKELTDAENQRDRLQKKANEKKKDYDQANDGFLVTKASMDESINDLRNKILNSDIDTCPLCRQKIDKELLAHSVDLAELFLSDYEKRKNEAKLESDAAASNLATAENHVSEIKGRFKKIDEDLNKINDTISIADPEILSRLQKAGLSPESDIAEQINQKKSEIEKENNTLDKQLKKYEEIQVIINKLNNQKNDLDKILNESNTDWVQSQNDIKNNNEKRGELETQIKEKSKEIESKSKELQEKLKVFYPTWSQNPQQTAKSLKTDAEQYLRTEKEYSEEDQLIKSRKKDLESMRSVSNAIVNNHTDWHNAPLDYDYPMDTTAELKDWHDFDKECNDHSVKKDTINSNIKRDQASVSKWVQESGESEQALLQLINERNNIDAARQYVNFIDNAIKNQTQRLSEKASTIQQNRNALMLTDIDPLPDRENLKQKNDEIIALLKESSAKATEAKTKINAARDNQDRMTLAEKKFNQAKALSDHWENINKVFGGDRFRNLAQTYILRPLLNNANLYLNQITDRYTLTCSEENEMLSILVLDRFHRNEVRSATVLSGGEKFMISLALSLALSSLNRADLNADILFIDEGFGTLDQECLESVMCTLERLGEIAAGADRRVGIITHREELLSRIPNKIKLTRCGEGRSRVEVVYEP